MSAVRAFPPLMRPEISDLMDAARLVRRAARQLITSAAAAAPLKDI